MFIRFRAPLHARTCRCRFENTAPSALSSTLDHGRTGQVEPSIRQRLCDRQKGSHMPSDDIPPEQHRQQAEGVREKAEDSRQDAEQDRGFTEEDRVSVESTRNKAEHTGGEQARPQLGGRGDPVGRQGMRPAVRFEHVRRAAACQSWPMKRRRPSNRVAKARAFNAQALLRLGSRMDGAGQRPLHAGTAAGVRYVPRLVRSRTRSDQARRAVCRGEPCGGEGG